MINEVARAERRCRATLAKHGYKLSKRSMDHDPYTLHNPAYTIIWAYNNTIEAQDIGLDDVIAWCDELIAEDAEMKEFAAFLQDHPAHVELLKVARGLDAETVAAVTCMATAYSNGATDAEALEAFYKALAFYGRKLVTTGPKLNPTTDGEAPGTFKRTLSFYERGAAADPEIND